jgi:hypothetical protein
VGVQDFKQKLTIMQDPNYKSTGLTFEEEEAIRKLLKEGDE